MRFGWQTRLSRSSEIEAAFKSGIRSNCGFFLMVHRFREPQTSHEGPRLCVIASRKVSKNAVDRNLLRRRFRDLFRQEAANLPPHLDLILIARRSMLQVSFSELQGRFQKACANIRQP